jgi:cell division control protein 11
MSFAGRRRGNKVKKGVQFTLMVVGQSSLHTSSEGILQTISRWLFVFLFLGASGTGRTTFVNTLCESEVLGHKVSDSPETAHVEEGIRIKPVNVGALQSLHNTSHFSETQPLLSELEEDGVRIALTIVDTPGFGDNIDNEFAHVSRIRDLVNPTYASISDSRKLLAT